MRQSLWAACIVVISVTVGAAHAGTIRADRSMSDYVNLAWQSAYDSEGKVTGWDASGGWAGSGTLISNHWVLTAAHVVQGASGLKFDIGGTTYRADGWVYNPGWTGSLSAGYDLGLFHLSSAVSGISAATRYTGSYELGKVATMVGYGMSGTGLTGATYYDGQKRAGNNVIDSIQNGRILRYDFDNPGNRYDSSMGSYVPLNLEYLIAPGDSGGGTFMNVNGINYLIGVHSFGSAWDGKINSDYGDTAGDIRVSAFNTWINSVISSSGATLATGKYGVFGGSAFDFAFNAADLAITSVPEPSTFGVLALGVIAALRRRK
jgi:V8-like Glu-specific endopeptidase